MPLAWALLAVTAGGLVFCWWARLHIGRLWSGTVTRKEGHRVVDTGPYALVRHPIYTGMIAAAFATGVLRGTIVAMAGAVLMTLGLWVKARFKALPAPRTGRGVIWRLSPARADAGSVLAGLGRGAGRRRGYFPAAVRASISSGTADL